MFQFLNKVEIKKLLSTFSADWRIQLSTRVLFGIREYQKERGAAALITVLSVMATSLLLIGFFSFTFYSAQKSVSNKISAQNDFYIAEAGLEDQLYRIKNQKNYSSSNTLPVGSGQSNITVTTSGNTKTILSEAVFGNFVRRLQSVVTLDTDIVEFNYGVQVGAGGLVMNQNSGINGNVYSNGPIAGNNSAWIDGDAIVATAITLNNQWTTFDNNETIFGEQNANPNVFDVAQSFKPSATGTLAQIDLYLKKTGAPDNITLRILTDNSGYPSKTTVTSATATLNSSLVTSSFGWVSITFSTMPTLTGGTTYWIMLDTSDSNNKYWHWGKDSNQGNSDGESKYSPDWNAGTPIWNLDSGDFNFKTWFGTGTNGINNVIVSNDVKANTITNSKICGDAYYKTIDSSSLTFLNNPSSSTCDTSLTDGTGYPNSDDPAVQGMPISDKNITQWKNDATAGGTISGDFSVTTDTSLGPQKITGNLLMPSNDKTLTITGTVYVQGYIDIIGNGSAIKCSVTLRSCIIITDSWIHIVNNVTFSGSGAADSFLMLMTTSNCNGTFSSGCTHHNAAIDIHNQATGAIFYAPNGMIYLHNGVKATEVTAYKLQLDNMAIITYAQGLANANFSSGPGASWQINDWKEVE